MPSYLHLRYGGKIKQFVWPMEPSTALQAIGHAFSINPDTIVGFKDKKGSIHGIEDLVRDPEEAAKQSFMVVVETEEKKAQVSARGVSAQNQSQNASQNLGLMLISNYQEFERIFLKGSPNSWFIIFVLNQRQQLDEIASKASGIISQFSDKVDFFTYFYNDSSEDLTVVSKNFPVILVYHGEKRLVEVSLGSNQRNLSNLLERIQSGATQDSSAQSSQGKQPQVAEDSSTKLALNQLDTLFKQNEVTAVEYYYTKTSLLERQGDAVAIFSRYSKTRDSDQLKSDIKDLTGREPRLASQRQAKPQPQPQPQIMKQNFVRPMTSEGRPKSQKPQPKPQLSLVQEKSIETTDDLESKRLISVQDANYIKNLIMEENGPVLDLIDSYDADIDDERDLSRKLTKFVERSNRNQEYPVERKVETYERPPSQGGASYFLESKSRKGAREHLYEKETVAKNDKFSTEGRSDQVGGDLMAALRNSTNVKNLPVDQGGMIIWLAENKAHIVRDVVNDFGGLGEIDRAVSSLVLLADKEFNSKLRENFNEKEREYINDNKNDWNSSIYAALKCFKYDQDLPGLLRSLEEAVSAETPVEKKASQNKTRQDDSSQADKLPISGSDSGNNKRSNQYMFPQNFSDLAVIREEDKVPSTKHATYNDGINTGFGSAISSQGEIGQSRPSPPVITTTTVAQDQGRQSAGSKYAQLLGRDQRADSFKGMFQLKLISSDNPGASQSRDQSTRGEVVQAKQDTPADDGTKNSLDAHVNVIIPAKSEVNPFTQTFIDKFYESQDNYLEGLEKFKGVLLNFPWITEDDVTKIEYLYENFYYELFEVIYNYEMSKNLNELARRLKEDILTVDLDNISTASTSPRERKRMTAYHSFKALLQNLRNDNYISEKQYKTYLYMYTEEDMTVLATYEVYQYTRDISDFIDTLLLIEKVQFFKNESKFFEDISNFNDMIEYQLKIIFSLKRYLTIETRETLEKIIRSGDTTIMNIYREYKKNRDNKNKNNLIHKLVNFAEENREVVKNYEKIIVQNKLNEEHKNVKRRELIENFEYGRLLPEVKHFNLLYESIDRDEELIHSIFEIYDFTKDKIDFIENITLVYKFLYRMFALEILDKHKEKYGMTISDLELVESMFKKKENSILGPTELLYATKDELEYVETVSLLIQAKRKIRGPF